MEDSQVNRRKQKTAAKEKASTRQLMGIDGIDGCRLKTAHGDLAFFIIRPTNISVLSGESVAARIYALMTVLRGMAELEMLCLNSRANFEDNKAFLKSRMEAEDDPAVHRLLERDAAQLDRMQAQTATAREFLIIVRLKSDDRGRDVQSYLSRIEESLKNQGFTVHRAESEDIKKLLAVYYEQNVTTEYFEDFDGERWVIQGE